jgi:hypothetical protein
MAGIFISYRRSDAGGHAGRLFDRLQARFGPRLVFRDVDDIAEGDAFPRVIQSALTTCQIIVVVIGPNWLTAADAGGARRLDNPRDWVRTETAGALRGKARVIPVLVGGARMPGADDLPDDLKPLADLSARTIDDTDWEADVTRLVDVLEKLLSPRAPLVRKASHAGLLLAGVGALAIAGFFALSTTVPDVVGRSVDEARRMAGEARLSVLKEARQVSSQNRGTVIGQTPRPGRRVGNANLTLVVAEREPVDLSKWIAIRNQGEEGTGPGFAMATAMSASLARQGRPMPLSPRYVYAKARALDPDTRKTEAGARVEYVCTVAREYGAVPESVWPYRALEPHAAPVPWKRLDAAAAAYKADVIPVRSLDAVYDQLRQGRFVVAVVMGAETWMQGAAPSSGQIPLVERPDPESAHVVVIAAIDPMNDRVRFANSWGAAWGDSGFGTMSETVADAMLVKTQMWAVQMHPAGP